MNSAIGSLFLVASDRGLESVFWHPQVVPFADSLKDLKPEIQILARAVIQLEEFLNGKRKVFDLPLAPAGTDFQKKVWTELEKIPYGNTASYIEVAGRIGNEKASRAVGTANGKNPLCIIVPCHRVVAASGALGGYSGGLEIKSRLLALESSCRI